MHFKNFFCKIFIHYRNSDCIDPQRPSDVTGNKYQVNNFFTLYIP